MNAVTPDLHEALSRLLEPAAAEAGVDLEDVEVRTAGRRRLVRVLVDADGGVDLDRVALVSTRISEVLDREPASGLLGQAPYVLEVSSPGVDRPLTAPRHWRRAHARLVQVTLTDGAEITGRITASDDSSVTLDVDGASRSLAYADIRRAQVQVEFRSSAADGAHVDDDAESDSDVDAVQEVD